MNDIRLVLRPGESLFEPPVLAPYQGQFEERSGFDRIVKALEVSPRQARPTIVLSVPASEAVQDHASAIHGMARARQAIAEETLSETVEVGRRALVAGLVVLGICMSLSALLRNDALPYEFVRTLFAEGLVIAGWVVLWRPIELLLYDTMPLRRAARFYSRLADLPVTVQAKET